MDRPKVKDLARGQWKAILPQLGVPSTFLTGKHGPCPMCDGKDRWRFDDKDGNGTWFCSHCQAGDGVKLVMAKLGLDFKEAARRIEGCLGQTAPAPPTNADTEKRDREAMNEVWKAGRRLDLTSVAGRYLSARTGVSTFGADLRSVSVLSHYAEGVRVPTTHPALIALVRDAEGVACNVHRTYLASSGGKAKVDPVRKTMRGGRVAGGAAIRLAEYTDVLGIAEGIETALSASVLHEVPVWAAVSALGVEQWKPPQGVRVMIFGDHDLSFTGHKASYALAWRLVREGFSVQVKIPNSIGDDWNSIHQRLMATTRRPVLEATA